jgi:hypothetical protein
VAKVGVAQPSPFEQRSRAPPTLEVLTLAPDERKPFEERDNRIGQVREAIDLPVPATIARASHGPDAERVAEEIERSPILLRHLESG